jgi:hypothetical protein
MPFKKKGIHAQLRGQAPFLWEFGFLAGFRLSQGRRLLFDNSKVHVSSEAAFTVAYGREWRFCVSMLSGVAIA